MSPPPPTTPPACTHPGAIVLVTRRLITDTTLALAETRRNADDTQLTYP